MKMIRRWRIKVADTVKVANFPEVGNFKKQKYRIKNTILFTAMNCKKNAFSNIATVTPKIIANSRDAIDTKGISFCNDIALINVISDTKVANFWKVGNLFIIVCCYLLITCSSGKSNAAKENLQTNKALTLSVPPCIQSMIDSAKNQPSGMAITEIRRYLFNGSKVYVVAAPCCDQFNNAYDSACNFLFAPSGGITGKGDRSNPDFFTQAKEDSLIWQSDKK